MPASIIGSAVIGAVGAKSAANKQAKAANSQMDLARETRDLTRADLQPAVAPLAPATNALMFELGLGDQPEGYGGYTSSPGYQYALEQGQSAIETSAAGSGNLYSGNTLKRLQEMGQGMAAQDYGNYINRLFGISSNAQSAAAGQGAANTAFGQQGATALANLGNAQAAGVTGMTNALTSGIDNYLGYKMFNDLQYTPPQVGGGAVLNPVQPPVRYG